MAVPQTGVPPTWSRSIPNQSLYPGQTVRLNIRNYQVRQDATITLRGQPPAWVTLNIQGLTREIVIAAPSTLSGGESFNIVVRASAFSTTTQRTETRDTSFVITILTPVTPIFETPIPNQNWQAGVASSVNLEDLRTGGNPPPTYAFGPGYTPPAWLTLNGSTLQGTPPVADFPNASTTVNARVRATNLGGDEDIVIPLIIARSIAPGFTLIPTQYAVQGESFSLDIASFITGTPTPTIASTGLPSWMSVSGTVLSGTPSGFTANTTQTVTITATNAAGVASYNFQIHIRIVATTFTETTASPLTMPHGNLTAIAATTTRFYYASGDNANAGRIFVTDRDRAAQSSETITLGAANQASTHSVFGLAVHDGFIYAVGGFRMGYVFKIRLSDSSLVGTLDVGASRSVAIPVVNGTRRLAVLRSSGTVQYYALDDLSPLPTIGFVPTLTGVDVNDWLSIAYDDLDDRLYFGTTVASDHNMYAFSPNGHYDADETVRLDSANTDPQDATYIDDNLFVVQGGSDDVYQYSATARILDIPAQEGFDGENWSLDLTPFTASDVTIAFQPGYTAPRWLSFDAGTKTLSATPLPAVTRSRMDDTYTIRMRGTHEGRDTDFNVLLTVRYIELPTWSAVPSVTLDQNVTPQIPSPNPPLVTSRVIHLTDYISNLDRAGPLTFTVEDTENSGIVAVLTERDVGGTTYNDVLTLTSPTSVSMRAGVESFDFSLGAANHVGNGAATLGIDVNVLTNVYINPIPAQTVEANAVDGLDLSRLAGGSPRPTFALGTITPTLTADVATIVSNANGQWSFRGSPNFVGHNVYTVSVIAINRISRASRNMQLTVDGRPHTLPNIAPVWKTGAPLEFDIVSGEMTQIDLTTLITQGRPTPTFAVYMATDITNLGGTVSISGTTLTVHAPNIDEPTFMADVQVSARNDAGGAIGTLSFTIEGRVAPTWSAIPRQVANIGTTYQIDLNAYVSGMPTPSVTFQPGQPAQNDVNADATLTNGVLQWNVPATITDSQVVEFRVQATSAAGTTPYSLSLQVTVAESPEWVTRDIVLYAREGVQEIRIDMAPYLLAGMPFPSLVLGQGAVAVPAAMSFHGSELIIQDVLDVSREHRYDFAIIARNAAGATAKQVSLIIQPSIDHGDLDTFEDSDYDMIRSLLDSRLTVAQLTNGVIGSDAFQGAALDWGMSTMPIDPANPRSEVQLRHKKRAIIYRTAGLLAGSVRRLTQESVQSVTTSFTQIQWNELQTFLFTRSEEEAQHASAPLDASIDILLIVEEEERRW